MHSLLSLTILIILLNVQSAKLISVANANEENENDYYDLECKCQNDGICVLDGDFCACKPGFTGRYCELSLTSGLARGCGNMLHEETQITHCSKCKCKNQLLACEAISTPACDAHLFEKKKLLARKTHLSTLIKLINEMETNAYNFYIDEYRREMSYEIVYKFIDSDDHDDMANQTSEASLLDNSKNRNKLIVLKAKKQNKITGIYFASQLNFLSSSSSQFNSNFFSLVFSNLILFYVYKLF